ncbi:MAG: hypothetical protein QOK10_1100 [Pseudonocardiales bacterium]|jgi:hypothetical protein|nr:hypothetical protein [Pseudonocardiales bacterium]
MTDYVDDCVWACGDLTPARRAALKHDLVTRIGRDKRRYRRHVATAVGVAAVAAAATVAAMLRFTPAATASWSAVPRPLSIGFDDPMVQQCLAGLPAWPSELVGRAQLVPMVAEKRGTSRAALLGGGDSQAICIAVDKSRTGGRTLSPALPAGTEISVAGNGGSTDTDSGDRYVYGRVAPRVVTVSIVTTTGLHVTASVAHGSYVAWWPGGAAPATLTAEDVNGQLIARISPTSR